MTKFFPRNDRGAVSLAMAAIASLGLAAAVIVGGAASIASAPQSAAATVARAAAASSGSGAGCDWSYQVSVPRVWMDDRQGQSHIGLVFSFGLASEAIDRQHGKTAASCPEYDQMSNGLMEYLVGGQGTQGAYILESRSNVYRSPVWVGNPYDSTTPGADSNVSIEFHGQTPNQVADSIEAWVAANYPGAALVNADVAG